MICQEYRYPELYREYKRRGAQVMFHSFHAAHIVPEGLRQMQEDVGVALHSLSHGSTLPEITVPASVQAAAANHIWISCTNRSARIRC